MTSTASSSSSTDRCSAEPELVSNAVVIKEEPIEEDIEGKIPAIPAFSIYASPSAYSDAQVKLRRWKQLLKHLHLLLLIKKNKIFLLMQH